MTYTPTPRTTVRRLPKRASYDQALVYSILDEGLVCHVGFIHEGQPVVIPTAYGRVDDLLYLHGSPASRMLRQLKQGIKVCITVTLIDGLVLARSAFHHSLNYRSVVIFGTASQVESPAEKEAALKAFTDHVIPGRWDGLRPIHPQEIAGTLVLALPLEEVSAKLRSGPPVDEEADQAWPVWAGVLPLVHQPQAPIPDPKQNGAHPTPDYLLNYQRGSRPESGPSPLS